MGIKIINTLIIISLMGLLASCQSKDTVSITLSGDWQVCLDSLNQDDLGQLEFNLMVPLPGTLDEAGVGRKNSVLPEMKRETMLHLKRRFEYIGKAWYRKTILVPSFDKSYRAILNLERVLWKSEVFVDGKPAGEANSLSVPHQYDLTDLLVPGTEQELLICIDNSRQFELNSHDMAHAYTNETQIKWNGILGDLSIYFVPAPQLGGIQLYPSFKDRKLTVMMKGKLEAGLQLKFSVKDQNGSLLVERIVNSAPDGVYTIGMPDGIKCWDEFSPTLYTLETGLVSDDRIVQRQINGFGFREIQTSGKDILINGKTIFLRGTLECAIFPLTGHPPVSVEEWSKVFRTSKSYGLNHIRFHSWCPPKAAFEAADRLGVYLQVEAPNWNTAFGADTASAEFIENEALRIVETYGNHPSFCFISMGNELQGDFLRMNNLVVQLKSYDPRHLYTTTTFTFEKGHGLAPEPVDDFFITQYTDSGWVRGQGVFDAEYPNFRTDYTHAVKHLQVPLVTHEIGQYSVYPNLNEIDKYTGVLEPVNFIAVKNDLEKKGLLHLANDYLMASGKLAKILYKEEIERALKTDGISGFQLLDLHDFPGQGTALVGLLDVFWDSKGIVDSAEFQQSCSEIVPLVWMEKAVYQNNESLRLEVGVANYFQDLTDQKLIVSLLTQDNQVVKEERVSLSSIPSGQTSKLGLVDWPLSMIQAAQQLRVKLQLAGTKYQNAWDVWVYPNAVDHDRSELGVVVTRSFAEAKRALEKGKKVFLNPEIDQINGVEGKFVQVFWSPVHFPNQPGTMGLLMDPHHPVFKYFPTEFHSNWQWWDLCKQSKTLDFSQIKVDPLVMVVDNFFKNRQLTNLFEVKVGNGKLVFSSMDLCSHLDSRTEAAHLRSSVLHYMSSDAFNPKIPISFDKLEEMFLIED